MPTGGLRSGLRRQDPVGDRKDYVLRRNRKNRQVLDVFGVLWIKGFFPKNEKYVSLSLFSGGDDLEVAEQRSKLRKQIKANIIVAAPSGKELEESDDGLLDLSDDDFFVN